MAKIIQCSACGKKLRIADDQLGMKVRCPECKVAFTAAEAPEVRYEASGRDSLGEERVSRSSVRRRPEDEIDDEDERGREARRRRRERERDDEENDQPRRQRERDEDDDDDDDRPRRRPERDEDGNDEDRPRRRRERDEEDDDDRPRRRRRRRSSGDPAALIHAPAMALRICGLVGVALGILAVIYNLIRLIGVGAAAPRVGPGGPPPMLAVIMGFIVGIVLTVAWCVIVIKGADCMASLSGYGMAVAACIIAMLP